MPIEYCQMKIKAPLFIILAIALLCCSGCSVMRLGYDHADWYLRYRINDYTSFNALQKEEIHRQVDIYMRWHRRNALPEYTRFLQDLYDVVQRNGQLKTGEVTRLRGEFNKLYRKTIAPAIRPTAHLLSKLDSGQIEELGNSFARKNRKQKNEMLFSSEQKNLVMRAERNVDFVEKQVGRLSDDQEKRIREISLRMPFVVKYYIEHREHNQAELIALLNNRAGEDKIAAFLWSWANTPEATRTPQQQQAIQSYENAMDEMTARIYELLTDRQKSHLREEIQFYIENFRYLSAEARTASAAPN